MDKSIKNAGVSLIEVMISMVLISLLLMAVASVFPRMSSHRKGIQEADIAKIIAGEVLEGLQYYSSIKPDNNALAANPNVCYSLCGGTCVEPPRRLITIATVNPALSWTREIIDTIDFAAFKTKWFNVDTQIGATTYKTWWSDACANAGTFRTRDVFVQWKKSGKTHNIKLTGAIE